MTVSVYVRLILIGGNSYIGDASRYSYRWPLIRKDVFMLELMVKDSIG